MPEKFRDNFENPEKYLFKYLEGENKQSQIRQGFIDYMVIICLIWIKCWKKWN